MSDISILNVSDLAKKNQTAGPSNADDTAVFATGVVYEIDPVLARVRILVSGGLVWLPAVAARYVPGGTARVLVDPITARPVLVQGAVGIRPAAVLGKVTATSTGKVTVTVFEGSHTIDSTGSGYTVGQSAWVLLDDWGTPVLSIAPSSVGAASGGDPSAPTVPTTATAIATIGPQSSGTWRSSYSKWDVWATTIHGGASDIYQGNGGGSGPLTGLACFGDQVANLGALSIEQMTLTVIRNGSGSGNVPLTVQGSPHGSRPAGAPSGAGATASTAALPRGASGSVDLPSTVCDAFRTGASKGLIAVGGTYAGFGGVGTPGSFVLTVRYTRAI